MPEELLAIASGGEFDEFAVVVDPDASQPHLTGNLFPGGVSRASASVSLCKPMTIILARKEPIRSRSEH